MDIEGMLKALTKIEASGGINLKAVETQGYTPTPDGLSIPSLMRAIEADRVRYDNPQTSFDAIPLEELLEFFPGLDTSEIVFSEEPQPYQTFFNHVKTFVNTTVIVDTETLLISKSLQLLQIKILDGDVYIYTPDFLKAGTLTLDKCTIIVHNVAFDLPVLQSCVVLKNCRFFCTYLGYSLDEIYRPHFFASLKDAYFAVTGDTLNKDFQKFEDWDEIILETGELHPAVKYAVNDTIATETIFKALYSSVGVHTKLFIWANTAIISAMCDPNIYSGCKIDIDYLKNLIAEKVSVLQETIPTCTELWRAADTSVGLDKFNINSAVAVPKVLSYALGIPNDNGYGKPLSVDYFRSHMDNPAIAQFFKLRRLTTEIKDLNKYLELGEGVIRPRYSILVSGRLAQSDPNLQNMSRDKEYRKMVIPTIPGNVFVDLDWSQIELVIVASITNCTALLNPLNLGDDIHRHTAKLMGLTGENARQIAKTCNFGLLYGMGAHLLLATLQEFVPDIDYKKASTLRSRWLNAYPEIKQWQNQINYNPNTKGGRRVYFDPQISRSGQPLNFPVQGTCADFLLATLWWIIHDLKAQPRFATLRLCQLTYDAILVECHPEIAAEVKRVLSEKMVKTAKSFLKNVTVNCSAAIGHNYGEVH